MSNRRDLAISTSIFHELYMEIARKYPAIYAYRDGNAPVLTEGFVEDICRAYPFVMWELDNTPYGGYKPSEHTVAWSTPYFRHMREHISRVPASRWDVPGVGYKYRDVIWVTLALLKEHAESMLERDKDYRLLYQCMLLRDNPSKIIFLNEYDMAEWRRQGREADARRIQELEEEREAERNSTERESQEAQQRDRTQEVENRSQSDKKMLLLSSGVVLAIILLFGRKNG